MLQHAREYDEAGVPFVFDPGQGLPMFNGDELLEFIRMAEYVTVNDYEAQMLQERTGKTIEQLSKLVKAFVVTLGARGSVVYTGSDQIDVPCVKAEKVVDPTGCGDAFRAGLLYGLASGFDWPTTGRLASLLGSIKIAQRGGQNHRFTRDEIAERYRETFGSRIW
jgi:adenosine kinase